MNPFRAVVALGLAVELLAAVRAVAFYRVNARG